MIENHTLSEKKHLIDTYKSDLTPLLDFFIIEIFNHVVGLNLIVLKYIKQVKNLIFPIQKNVFYVNYKKIEPVENMNLPHSKLCLGI